MHRCTFIDPGLLFEINSIIKTVTSTHYLYFHISLEALVFVTFRTSWLELNKNTCWAGILKIAIDFHFSFLIVDIVN